MKQRFTAARKSISRRSLVILTHAFRFLGRVLPYRVAAAAGGIIGSLAYALIPRDRKRALENLSRVYPDRGPAWVRTVCRRTFRHLGRALMEFLAAPVERLDSIVTFKGLENLQAALDLGRGVIYVTGHIGNWELMSAAVGTHCSVSVVAAPLEPEAVNDLVVSLRMRTGVRTIVRNRPGAARELIRVFRENRVLGILIDQDTDVEGAFIDFLGRPAWTPTAAAQMAIKFGAAVVYGYIRRDPDGRHTVTIEGPLTLTRTGRDDEDIRTNTAMLTQKLEASIRSQPEQWVWMHRRWRRQP